MSPIRLKAIHPGGPLFTGQTIGICTVQIGVNDYLYLK